jgi:hypothetical protein
MVLEWKALNIPLLGSGNQILTLKATVLCGEIQISQHYKFNLRVNLSVQEKM